MSQDFLVRMQIPLSYNLFFDKWLPEESNAIIVEKNTKFKFLVKIWFDYSCMSPDFLSIVEMIKTVDNTQELDNFIKEANKIVNKINVDVEVQDLSNEAIDFFFQRNRKYFADKIMDIESQKNEEYFVDLENEIINSTVEVINRFLSYLRNYKRQYWIKEYEKKYDYIENFFKKNSAKITLNKNEWIDLYPRNRGRGKCTIDKNDEVRLKEEEWLEVKKFVSSGKKVDLVMELLVNADSLAFNSNARNAIIEAVTALEISLNDFASQPNYLDLLHPDAIQRIEGKNLKSLVEKLGLRGSINVLLPILFSEKIQNKLLKDCEKAVELRNNIIHHGKRKVDNQKVIEMIESIRQLCTLLKQSSACE